MLTNTLDCSPPCVFFNASFYRYLLVMKHHSNSIIKGREGERKEGEGEKRGRGKRGRRGKRERGREGRKKEP